jgi:hypothetical protein
MTRILALNRQNLKRPASGGADVRLEEISRRPAKKGYEVDLLCCNFTGSNKKHTAKYSCDIAADKTENLIEQVLSRP